MAGQRRTKGKDFSVGGFSWSPDSTTIAFSATVNPDLIQGGTADIYLLSLAGDRVRKIVSTPGPDNGPQWSPDGKQIVFSSAMAKDRYFALNSRLAVVPADGGTPRSITDGFDENPGFVEWRADGLCSPAARRRPRISFVVDPATGRFTRISQPDALMAGGFSDQR